MINEAIIINTIKEITAQKINSKKFPTFVLSLELFKKLELSKPDTIKAKVILNELIKTKQIIYGQTLNSIWLKLS